MVTSAQANEFVNLVKAGNTANEALTQMQMLGNSNFAANVQSLIQSIGNFRTQNEHTINALRSLGQINTNFANHAAPYLQQIATRGGPAAGHAAELLFETQGHHAVNTLRQMVQSASGASAQAFEFLKQMATSGMTEARVAMNQIASGNGPYAAQAREVIKSLPVLAPAAAGAGGLGAGGGAGAGAGTAPAAGGGATAGSGALAAGIAGAVIAFLLAGYVWSQWPEWMGTTELGPAAAGRTPTDDTRWVGDRTAADGAAQFYVVRVRGLRIYSVRTKAAIDAGIPLSQFRHGGTSDEHAEFDEQAGPFTRHQAMENLALRIRGMHKPTLAGGMVGMVDGAQATIDDRGAVGIAELEMKNPEIRNP